jgi:hypothetical protein
MRLQVRIRNSMYERRAAYAYPIPEYLTYTGDVYPRPVWVKDNQFCLTTGDPQFPFRVIDKDSIVDGYRLSTATPNATPQPKSYIVQGVKASYVVTEDTKGKLSCSCTGFSYRKKCSHVDEVRSYA